MYFVGLSYIYITDTEIWGLTIITFVILAQKAYEIKGSSDANAYSNVFQFYIIC